MTHLTDPREFQQFYADLQAWIECGCPPDNVFDFHIGQGLCSNYKLWCRVNGFSNRSLLDFVDQWISGYPFNCEKEYHKEHNKYTNQERLNWIKIHSRPAN